MTTTTKAMLQAWSDLHFDYDIFEAESVHFDYRFDDEYEFVLREIEGEDEDDYVSLCQLAEDEFDGEFEIEDDGVLCLPADSDEASWEFYKKHGKFPVV